MISRGRASMTTPFPFRRSQVFVSHSRANGSSFISKQSSTTLLMALETVSIIALSFGILPSPWESGAPSAFDAELTGIVVYSNL